MTRARTRTAAGAAAALCAVAAAPAAAGAAPLEPAACLDPDPGGDDIRTLPWAQRWLDPARTWPFSTGAGVLVAVLDSGVDDANPQLAGLVRPGLDLTARGDGRLDCVSHGTAVASLVVARARAGTGFRGLAPGARILPVRISEQDASQGGGQTVPASAYAAAIVRAAAAGADVVDVSVPLYRDYPSVRAAVLYAQRRGALVVAAVGDNHRDDVPEPTSYPAAYPGVLGVGAIGVDGLRVGSSQTASVDLVAPGAQVLAAARARGLRYWSGTAMAAGLVSAAAALVRAARPTLSAAAVAARLTATATPPPAGVGYGAGVVDPHAAVLDTVTGEAPATLPTLRPPPPDARALRLAAERRAVEHGATRTGVVAGLLAVGALLAAGVLTYGRRRRWRVGRAEVAAPVDAGPPQTTSLFD